MSNTVDLPLNIHLFGASTSTGQSFIKQAACAELECSLHSYSRSSTFNCVDFTNPETFIPVGEPGTPAIWISFGPIWLLAPFLEQLSIHHPERLQGLRGVIACSSSSSITKRFAANRFDWELAALLKSSEQLLLANCQRLNLNCRILCPTLIYGKVGTYSDRNLSRVLQQLRRFPLLPLPSDTGLRQPIHASQLASVALHSVLLLSSSDLQSTVSECIPLGGDSTLTYTEMIRALQQAQPRSDPAHSCKLLPIPNRFFFLLAAPLLLRSPKSFEAVHRIGSNLAGFTPAHQILGCEPVPFPVQPLA